MPVTDRPGTQRGTRRREFLDEAAADEQQDAGRVLTDPQPGREFRDEFSLSDDFGCPLRATRRPVCGKFGRMLEPRGIDMHGLDHAEAGLGPMISENRRDRSLIRRVASVASRAPRMFGSLPIGKLLIRIEVRTGVFSHGLFDQPNRGKQRTKTLLDQAC